MVGGTAGSGGTTSLGDVAMVFVPIGGCSGSGMSRGGIALIGSAVGISGLMGAGFDGTACSSRGRCVVVGAMSVSGDVRSSTRAAALVAGRGGRRISRTISPANTNVAAAAAASNAFSANPNLAFDEYEFPKIGEA